MAKATSAVVLVPLACMFYMTFRLFFSFFQVRSGAAAAVAEAAAIASPSQERLRREA